MEVTGQLGARDCTAHTLKVPWHAQCDGHRNNNTAALLPASLMRETQPFPDSANHCSCHLRACKPSIGACLESAQQFGQPTCLFWCCWRGLRFILRLLDECLLGGLALSSLLPSSARCRSWGSVESQVPGEPCAASGSCSDSSAPAYCLCTLPATGDCSLRSGGVAG